MVAQIFILWALSYLLHSTLLFLISRIVIMLPFPISNKHRELVLRFALLCAIPTSVLQGVFGVGINAINFSGITATTSIATSPFAYDIVASKPFILPGEVWLNLLVVVWGVVAMFLLTRYIFARKRFLSGIRPLTPIHTMEIRAALDDVQRFLAKPVKILVATSDNLASPLAVDGKSIYLPSHCIHSLPPLQLKCLFAHEVAHIIRRDNLWLIIHKIVGSFLFFQPLNRVVIDELRNVSEKLCDGWAVTATGSRLELARGLVTVASWYAFPRYAPDHLGAVSRKSQLKQRIELLLSMKEENLPLHKKSLYGAFGTAMIAMVMLMPGFSFSKSAEQTPANGRRKGQRIQESRGMAKTKMVGEQEVAVQIETSANIDQKVDLASQVNNVEVNSDVKVSIDREIELNIKPAMPATSNETTMPKN